MRQLLTLAGLFWATLLLVLPAQAAPEFPALSGRVVDQAGMLSAATQQQLTVLLQQNENSSSNQLVVVTVNSLQGYTIEEYGYQLGRHWGIGQKGLDNGVLLIVAPSERKVRIEVGYGLEGTLTDALSSNIIQTVILPRFRQGRMEQGVIEGTRATLAAIAGTYEVKKGSRTTSGSRSTSSAFDFFGTAVILSMIFGGGVRHFIGNRVIAGIFVGGIAGLIGFLLYSLAIGVFAGIAVFLLQLFIGSGGPRGGGGTFGGGGYYGGGYSSGGSFGGGFSGGGGSFGGGGASGGW